MQAITLPQKPKYSDLGENTGKFEIQGCYPGYGTTLGNALRRVLLSSLSGAAIISVKIKGVKHEFSTIPNVQEDVIQIILNLKKIRFKLHKDEAVKLALKVKGEKEIKAGAITHSSDVEIVNPDLHIATITNVKGEIEMEMEVDSGIGYVPVEQQEREKKEVGIIALDAIYTPIKRVNYTIENMRVGKRTDFEKINLTVVTDGSVTPQEAFSRAVNILVEQFDVLKVLDEQVEKEEEISEEKEAPKEEKEEEKTEDPKNILVTELKSLSTRTLNVLEKSKVKNLGGILKLTEEQLKDLEGMGDKGIKEIKKAIGDYGFNLKK